MNHKAGQKLAKQLKWWWLMPQSQTSCQVEFLRSWQYGLWPILLNFCMNNLDDVIECTLNKLEVDTKLSREVGTPEEPPCRETVTGWNCMRFKKGACEIVYLEWSNPKHQYRLGSGYVIHLECTVLNTF